MCPEEEGIPLITNVHVLMQNMWYIKGATLINEQNMKFVRDLLMSYLGTKFWAILVHNIMKIIAFHSNGTLSACQA